MISTKCLRCGRKLLFNIDRDGEGYFLGYDGQYYGDTWEDSRDPHDIIGYFCKQCGDKLKEKAERIGWEKLDG